MTTVTQLSQYGWDHCIRMEGDGFDLIAVADIGPRILHFSCPGMENIFKLFPEQLGQAGEPAFQPRGGHRLWTAPEDVVSTYIADNHRCACEFSHDTIEITSPEEPHTGLVKRMSIKPTGHPGECTVVHTIDNRGAAAVRLAPWSLTVLKEGGFAALPIPARGTFPEKLLPTHPLVLWAYTDFADPRWRFLGDLLLLRQQADCSSPQKAGFGSRENWGAYFAGGQVFLKRSEFVPDGDYPDFGCSFETFTNSDMLELETLGPMTTLEPGQTVTHVESWSIKEGTVPFDASADQIHSLLPR